MYRSAHILLILFPLLACSDAPLSHNIGNDFYPLSRGNWWRYAYTPYFADQDSTHIERISGDTVINEQAWRFLGQSQGSGPLVGGAYYRNELDGLWALRLLPRLEPMLIYKHPAHLDDSYTAWTNTDTVVVVGISRTIEVPAGTFTCYVYQRRSLMEVAGEPRVFVLDTYVAPKVGKVMEDIYSIDEMGGRHDEGKELLLEYWVN